MRVTLVCIPSERHDGSRKSRTRRCAHVPPWLTAAAAAEDLQRRLQATYPGAVVRPREALAEVSTDHEVVWYVTNRAYRSRISAQVDVPGSRESVFQSTSSACRSGRPRSRSSEIRITPDLVGLGVGGQLGVPRPPQRRLAAPRRGGSAAFGALRGQRHGHPRLVRHVVHADARPARRFASSATTTCRTGSCRCSSTSSSWSAAIQRQIDGAHAALREAVLPGDHELRGLLTDALGRCRRGQPSWDRGA